MSRAEKFLENLKVAITEWARAEHGDVVFVAKFKSSSNPDKDYETTKYSDGTYSCNCPGWTRGVKGGERICKHVKELGGQAYKEKEKS